MSHPQVSLTRSQAACVFFGKDVNPENGSICERKLEALPEVDLCYVNDDPTEPFLVDKSRIKFCSFRYQTYRDTGTEKAASPSPSPDSTQLIHCEVRLLEFVNSVFLADDPQNETVYERREMTSEDIFNIVKQHTTLYDRKGPKSFTYFVSKNKAHFLNAQVSRKRSESGRTNKKLVFLMKEDDRAFLSANMADYQARYERLLRGLKASNFQVLGYARKSPHHLQPQALRANLGNMIACLRTRSLVDRVYVSPNTSAKSPIASRDMDRNGELLLELDLEDCAGSTQDLLVHLASTTAKICLVFVDYAALSTEPNDVRDFIKNHDVVKYVIIDRMQDTGRYEVYNRTQMLGAEVCSKFDCRSGFPHRSK